MSSDEFNVVYVSYAKFENSFYSDIRLTFSHDLYDVMQDVMDMHVCVLINNNPTLKNIGNEQTQEARHTVHE